ncbi:MAG TPA: hypothetical protein VK395_02245 [Gemmataceae bacterium]|nr:hypothetical protein [Gemmataceae bacterium]
MSESFGRLLSMHSVATLEQPRFEAISGAGGFGRRFLQTSEKRNWRRAFLFVAVGVIGLHGVTGACFGKFQAQVKPAPEDQFQGIVREYEAARRVRVPGKGAAQTASQVDKSEAFAPFAERLFGLVEQHPDSAAAMHALAYVICTAPDTQQSRRAVQLLKPRVAKADLRFLGENLTGTFPVGMEEVAPFVFQKAQSSPADPYAPALVAWACYASARSQQRQAIDLFHRAFEFLVQSYGTTIHPWSALQYADWDSVVDTQWAERQLRLLLAQSTKDQVRALAAHVLAGILSRRDERSQAEAETWAREAVRVSQVLKKASGLRLDDTEERASILLLKIQHLGLGKSAPEIVGRDIQDQLLKLSDYRGQVVLLDFWGFW